VTAPATPADLYRVTRLGMLGQAPVQGRAAHAGDPHKLADPEASGCRAQGEPQRFRASTGVSADKPHLSLLCVGRCAMVGTDPGNAIGSRLREVTLGMIADAAIVSDTADRSLDGGGRDVC
jgi:hypothetical protein